VKRSILVEAAGGPLAVVIAGANVHDTKLLAQTLEAIVVERPKPTAEQPQHLCLDKGYDNPTGAAAVADHGYVPHIRRVGEEKLDPASGEKRFPARRWVVERTQPQDLHSARDAQSDSSHDRTRWAAQAA
jgi:putative transposase